MSSSCIKELLLCYNAEYLPIFVGQFSACLSVSLSSYHNFFFCLSVSLFPYLAIKSLHGNFLLFNTVAVFTISSNFIKFLLYCIICGYK